MYFPNRPLLFASVDREVAAARGVPVGALGLGFLALVGASLDDPASWSAAREALSRDFTPLTDMRASAAYRSEVAANLLFRALMEISGAGAPTRLGDLRAAE